MLRTWACLSPVGEEAVDDVHHAAEHGGADGLALLLVGGARPHLVERLGRLADVEPPDGPGRGLGPGRHLGHAQHGLEAERLAQVVEQALGVAVEQDRRLAGRRRCWPTAPRARRWGTTAKPRSSKISFGMGNWIEPASSNR